MEVEPAINQYQIFPTKEQAIILPALEGISTEEYVFRVGEIIGGKNVTFAFKMSDKEICLYLKSKVYVNELLSIHKYLKIKNFQIPFQKIM